jgi:transcription initiation factor IIE alpha subunit
MSEHKKLARMASLVLFKHTYALDRESLQSEQQQRHKRFESSGLLDVVVAALTRRHWTREEDLAFALKLNPKQIRRALRHLEVAGVLDRAHVKERNVIREQQLVDKGVMKVEAEAAVDKKTASWCCLNYARLVDSLRFRFMMIERQMRRKIDGGTHDESYACKNVAECGKRFSSLDSARLFDVEKCGFVCDSCGCEVARAGEDGGPELDSSARESKQALKLRLERFKKQIESLEIQIEKCLRYPAPSFGTLQEYVVAKRRTKEAREAAALGEGGGYWGSIGVARGTQAFEQRLEETTFEINIGDNNNNDAGGAQQPYVRGGDDNKEMPEWITRELVVNNDGNDDDDDQQQRRQGGNNKNANANNGGDKSEADLLQEQYAKALLTALRSQQAGSREVAMELEEKEGEEEKQTNNNNNNNKDVEMKQEKAATTTTAGEEEEREEDEEEEEWEEA